MLLCCCCTVVLLCFCQSSCCGLFQTVLVKAKVSVVDQFEKVVDMTKTEEAKEEEREEERTHHRISTMEQERQTLHTKQRRLSHTVHKSNSTEDARNAASLFFPAKAVPAEESTTGTEKDGKFLE